MYNDYFDHEERISNRPDRPVEEQGARRQDRGALPSQRQEQVLGEVHYKLYYKNGQFTGSLGTLTDVTERKKAEMELFKSNQRLAMQSQKLAMAGQLASGDRSRSQEPADICKRIFAADESGIS